MHTSNRSLIIKLRATYLLDTRQKLVISFTLRKSISQGGKDPDMDWIGGCVGSNAVLEAVVAKNIATNRT
jgi:hypothetical protein